VDWGGFRQLVDARVAVRKQFFTQLGVIGGIDGKPPFDEIKIGSTICCKELVGGK